MTMELGSPVSDVLLKAVTMMSFPVYHEVYCTYVGGAKGKGIYTGCSKHGKASSLGHFPTHLGRSGWII
jgi:hypothetical protein